MMRKQNHGQSVVATWEKMGITPPRRKDYPKLSPIEAAQADKERLTTELEALQTNGRLGALPANLMHAVSLKGIRVDYTSMEGVRT